MQLKYSTKTLKAFLRFQENSHSWSPLFFFQGICNEKGLAIGEGRNVLHTPQACQKSPSSHSPPCCSQGMHSCDTHWAAPATICGDSADCWGLDPNCRGKMAQGTNPFSKMIRALALIPPSWSLMRAHEQCTGHAEQQKCNCPQKSHFSAQRCQKLFLLQAYSRL